MTNTPAAPMTPRKALEIAEFHHQQHRDITAIQSWQDCTAWPCRAVAGARSTPAEPLDVTSDAFRDALSSAMQDHICDDRTGWPHPRGNVLDPTAAAEMLDGCDDLCADDIADRLAARLRSPEGDR